MAVKRILDIDIRNKGLFSAIYGNISDGEFFVDSDLKKYNLWQQLFVYLKSMLYDNVVFYDTTNNFHSYSKSDLIRFLNLEEETKNEEPQKYQSRHIRSALGSRRNKKEAEKTIKPKNEKQLNSAIRLITDFGGKHNFYRTNETLEIENYLKNNLANKKKKTALIIKNPENSTFQGIEKYITLFKILDNNYAIDDSQNKVIIVHSSNTTNSFIESYDAHNQLFLDDFFKNLFLKNVGENNFEIVKKNVHKVEFSDEIEIQNLINEIRITDKKEIDLSNFETIVSSLKKKEYTISSLASKLEKITKINLDILINNKIINSPFVEINPELILLNLSKVKGQNNISEIFSTKLESHYRNPRENPISFMLVGTSGVGKTYTAELLAESMQDNGFELAKLNMTEYMTEQSVNKLLGSEPGYVGYNDMPILFEKIKSTNKLIILFDEIEKAHNKVITALMQLLDKGSMFWKNQEADFKDCIIIFTSNASRENYTKVKQEQIQMGKSLLENKFQNKLKEILTNSNSSKFLPEFCGRINTFLIYDPLSREDIIEVALESIPEYFKKIYSINIKNINKEYIATLANEYKGSQFGLRDFKKNRKDFADALIRNNKIEINEDYDIVKIDLHYQLIKSTQSNSNTIKDIISLSKRLEKQSKIINKEEITRELYNVKGQNDSITSIIDSIDNWFISKEKPISFFLVGPSGVGKTETFKVLNKSLQKYNYSAHRIDCNLLSDKTGIAEIIGSKAGYLDSNNEPQLFEKLRLNGEGKLVVLFDEIEKADPKILITLMGLLDEGRLSWNKGEGDFRKCIFIFTSNIAQREFKNLKQNLLNKGLKNSDDDFQNKIAEQLVEEFRKNGLGPEIVGRINKIFVYNPVNGEMIRATTKGILISECLQRNLSVQNIDNVIIEYLIKEFSGNERGVRPIKNLLIENINREYRNIFLNIDEEILTKVDIINNLDNNNLLKISLL